MSPTDLFASVAGFLWGFPAVCILLSIGTFFTVKTQCVQFRGLPKAFGLLKKEGSSEGELSGWQALATSLGGTVGAGNISGVAAAILFGGPGAVFWMWMSAILGMATTFSSCSLALAYREKNAEGEYVGGPMYVLQNALGYKKMAVAFVVFTVFASIGTGNMIPANALKGAILYLEPGWQNIIPEIAVLATILVGLPVVGGVKRIGQLLAVVVPVMCFGYLLAVALILMRHLTDIPAAFMIIIHDAFHPMAVGGGILGSAIQFGVARGLFSNEAGQGSLPIIHAVAKTEQPWEQGLIAMLGPFIDTIVICTLTALTLIVSGIYGAGVPSGMESSQLALLAFEKNLGGVGAWFISVSLIFFAYSTIVAWAYYGEAAIAYLNPNRYCIYVYRFIYTVMVYFGVCLKLQLVWMICDIAMVLMMLPNIFAVFSLRDQAAAFARAIDD